MSYRIDPLADRITSFGLYSFDKGNPMIGKDVFNKMEELVEDHHSIEWRMISCNPAKRSYDRFCKKHSGNVFKFTHVTKDKKGNWIDEYVYEIVNKETVESL